MASALNSIRDYTQSHPVSVATGFIIALPGAYLLLTGQACTTPGAEIVAKSIGLCCDAPGPSHSPAARITNSLSLYETPLDVRLHLPISRWKDKPTPTFLLHLVDGTCENVRSFLAGAKGHLALFIHDLPRSMENRWENHYSLPRGISVAISSAIPGVFLLFVRHHPQSWAAKRQTQIANVLQVLALITVANQRLSIQDLLVTVLVMTSFEVWQRRITQGTIQTGHPDTPSAVETLLSSTHSAVAKSDIVMLPTEKTIRGQQPAGTSRHDFAITNSKDEGIAHLRKSFVELQTKDKSKDTDLERTRQELQNTREKLNETFAEYTSLRDELKTLKANGGRDHQAAIYRKDIELFALRKSIEQKDAYAQERDVKLEEIRRHYKAALDLKEAQLRSLKQRVGTPDSADKQSTHSRTKSEGEHQSALQVKLYKVKGRSSDEVDRNSEEKDAEIEKLRERLAEAERSSGNLAHAQAELRRSWNATLEAEQALRQERDNHTHTRNELQEIASRLEEELRKTSQKNSPARLPTIDEQDRRELEAMFNAAQQDNLRLHSDLEAMDKELRSANARLATKEEEVESLQAKLRLEQAISTDMEGARPSVVHRVHFQRMEGQLKESRELLAAKDHEIEQLQCKTAANDSKINDLKKDVESSMKTRAELEAENTNLKKSVTELEATKEQLMFDHERLAKHRTRERNSHSTPDHASARSSGATLITEPINVIATSDVPLPPRPVTIAGESSPVDSPMAPDFSMISNDIPPQELRSTRRKSLTLKGLMRKMTGKEHGEHFDKERKEEIKEAPRPKTALAPKDKNAHMRPKTAVASMPKKEEIRPRYYQNMLSNATATSDEVAKPKTSAAQKENDVSADTQRPKSRGWGSQSRKLVRKSLI
ncbi:hypothetical protein BCR34DRAFT_178230 [Clohesyomyces aquaticus]|uniref:Uncharacterized protein n=1 Tax=Clohesyomyces aquaticus TaxID=1231657 RepID=A0A1Y1ZZH0_9PLEO|nr:hypothetical protein BCR34DRAFT_178230 [Clohesyomyces aquaticus]